MKTFSCDRCGFLVFFEDTRCRNCGAALGFIPEELCMATFDAGGEGGAWRRIHAPGVRPSEERRRPCHNYAHEQVCNWTVADDADELCRSCRHTEITSALRSTANRERWRKLERAKRRLFYSLFQLGLPLPERGADGGLTFRFVENNAPHSAPDAGPQIITVEIDEADDVLRDVRRTQRHEPRRTLLGHFRHESGHYYWEQLIAGGPRLEAFRALFGDERRDYAEASAAYYASGPAAGWFDRYITAYATVHPRDDWAETWAHYLVIIDALDTAAHWGLALQSDQDAGGPADLPTLRATERPFREVLIEQWLPLSQFLNSMSRSVGRDDAFPSIVAPPVLDKICFVNDVVAASRVAAAGGYEPVEHEGRGTAGRGALEPEQPTATETGSARQGAASPPQEKARPTGTGAQR